MTRSFSLLAVATVKAAALSGPSLSHDALQPVMKVDPASLATGYRTCKMIGSGQPRR
jgi:hypothetical protein